MQFKILVKNCVRLAAIAPGRLEIGLTDDAPKSLPSDISQRLLNWTGIRWIVTVTRDVAGQTISEAETERRDNLVTDARADPDVAAILAAFPGAKSPTCALPCRSRMTTRILTSMPWWIAPAPRLKTTDLRNDGVNPCVT